MRRVSLDSAAVAHGLGLFETMLAIVGVVVRPEAHYARMAASAEALGFPVPEREAFLDAVESAAAGSSTVEAAIRALWVAGGNDADRSAWLLDASAGDIPAITLSRRERGRVVTLDPSLARSLPEHKLTSYAASVIGSRRAVDAGADEALFVDREGLVLEGASTNIFAVDADRIITAPVSAGILPGIVRQWVVEAAPPLGIEVVERPPSVEELRRGGFMTSSLTLLAPIRVLDGAVCDQPGPAYARLLNAWEETLESKIEN